LEQRAGSERVVADGGQRIAENDALEAQPPQRAFLGDRRGRESKERIEETGMKEEMRFGKEPQKVKAWRGQPRNASRPIDGDEAEKVMEDNREQLLKA
jgi:hypothetical protein